MQYKMTSILFFLGLFVFVILLLLPMSLKGQATQPEIRHYVEYHNPINYVTDNPKSGPDAFYGTGHADEPEKYRKEVAPLTRERFVRRIKMLFGMDITHHYDDKGHCYLTPTIAIFPETQLAKIRQVNVVPGQGGKPKVMPMSHVFRDIEEIWGADVANKLFTSRRPLSFGDIMLYCKWAYYNDDNAYSGIKKGDVTFKNMDIHDEPEKMQHVIARHRYAAPFDCRDSLEMNGLFGDQLNPIGVPIRGDVLYIRNLDKIGRYRTFNNITETGTFNLNFDIMEMLLERHYRQTNPEILTYRPVETEVHYVAKPPSDSLRYGSCYVMGILPNLKLYLTVPNYVSLMGESVKEFLHEKKEEFEKYDYFGYTLLRDLAKGKKIDNSKIGVPLTATAMKTAKMRLDPHDSSIDFDTLAPGELFTVYEMGYDKYYLVQCAKPIEEWEWDKAGEDGFAQCTGRMERVWGYVPKNEVEILDKQKTPVTPFVEWGIVSDADGYSNLRASDNTSKVVERLDAGTWVKILSYDMQYYLVETISGTQGRVHKTRVIW